MPQGLWGATLMDGVELVGFADVDNTYLPDGWIRLRLDYRDVLTAILTHKRFCYFEDNGIITADFQSDIEEWLKKHSTEITVKMYEAFQIFMAENSPPEWMEGRPEGWLVCKSCGEVGQESDMEYHEGNGYYCAPNSKITDRHCFTIESPNDYAPRRDL